VLGLGRFGSSLARSLEEMGHEVLGIDTQEHVVQDLSEELTHVVQADVTDEAALKALGLRNFDVCVVAIADLQPSILATATHEIDSQFLSAAKARKVLGWAPTRDVADALVETVDWYRMYLADHAS
jgi:trk system potassium uptake protein TrkA